MSVGAVGLREWESATPENCPALAGRRLADRGPTRRLAKALTDSGRLEVLELARGLALRATSWVGRVTLDNLTITIRPKIPDPATGAPVGPRWAVAGRIDTGRRASASSHGVPTGRWGRIRRAVVRMRSEAVGRRCGCASGKRRKSGKKDGPGSIPLARRRQRQD